MEGKPKHTLIHVTMYDKKLEQPRIQNHRWLLATKVVNKQYCFCHRAYTIARVQSHQENKVRR
jgi:hypothetical protein